nr:hypothetical protein [Catellatospora tritici]
MADDHLLPSGGAGVALHGVSPPAEVPGDLTDAITSAEKIMDDGVLFLAALRHPPGGLDKIGRRCPIGWRRGCCEAGLVLGDAPFDGGGEVLPQVEPVGDLDGVGRAGAGAVDVGAGPVAADHLSTGRAASHVANAVASRPVTRSTTCRVWQSMSTVP